MQRKQKELQSKRNHQHKPKYSFLKIAGIVLLILLTLGAVLVIANRLGRRDGFVLPFGNQEKNNHPKGKNSCTTHFIEQRFNTVKQKQAKAPRQIVMIQEIHGQYETKIADCLDEMLTANDRLLIEAPDNNGEPIPCDSVHPAYKRFNGKVECFGFDVPINEDRIRYAECSWRANFIGEKIYPWVRDKAKSTDEVVRFVNSFADFIEKIPDQNEGVGSNLNIKFNERSGKYLRERIAKRITNMNFGEISQFLIKENNEMAARAQVYQARTRDTVTNDALVQQVKHHNEALTKSKTDGRLFVVAGAAHLDPDKNKKFQEIVDQQDEIVLLKIASKL
jgi:hypothetical protein